MTADAQFTHAHMVRFERALTAPVEQLWRLLTDTTTLPGWYGKGVIEPRAGGKVDLMAGHIRGIVTQWQPTKRIAYTWNVFMPNQLVSDFPESHLTLELGEGTLTLTHLPVLEQFVKLNACGWHTFLDMVEAASRGDAVEERAVYMKKNAALYGVTLPSQ